MRFGHLGFCTMAAAAALALGSVSLARDNAAQPPAPAAQQPPPPPAITDPLVREVLATNPTAPEDLVVAIRTLINLKHAAVARPYAKALLDAPMDDEAMFKLVQKLGSSPLMQMAAARDVQPEGRDAARKILEGAERYATDPNRLAGLIEQLKDPAERVRERAIGQLRYGGAAAASALLGVLADAARAPEHRTAQQALVELESNATGPLLGALQSDDAALKVHAAAVLAALEVRDAIPWLLGPAHSEQGADETRRAASAAIARLVGRSPSREEAIALLRQFALKYYRGGRPGLADSTGQVLIWDWDAEKKQSVQRLMPAEDAGWLYAYRLSRDLYALAPEDAAARRMYLASLLQFESYRQGLDKPLPEGPGGVREAAAALGGAAVLDVMGDSMAAGRIPAATACARLLADLGSADLLYERGETAAIVRAAQHPDRRLRFAALETIIKWDPKKPYAGSADVAASLAFLAASNGKLQAVLVDTLPGSSSRLAGFLAELDYDPKVVGTGRDLVKQAIASPDVGLVIVDARLAGVGADQIVQQLRTDSRTAAVPIAFLRDVDYPEAAERLARRHAPAIVLSRPSTTDEMKFQLDLLLREVGRQYVSLAERQ
ncbi:MAG: hypothetical protein HYS13_19705, partial [Planctomycetia bacterium]|nr:hypothetical protein [Planctomycetia bacterium]